MRLAKLSETVSIASIALISLVSVSTSQAATIDTTPGIYGAIGRFGEYEQSGISFGQTFIAPTEDNILNEFTFFYSYSPDSRAVDVVDFRAFVAAFDSTTQTIVGDALFESASQSTTFDPIVEQPFTFSTGGLTLAPGQEYIAFLSPVKDLDGIEGFGFLSYAGEFVAPYEDGGGRAVRSFQDNFSDLIAQPFDNLDEASGDLGFRATFSSKPVPEPTSVLGILALGVCGGVAAFKRKN
jgi:PEP-CTERM motif